MCIISSKGVITMPNIKPISDLRNYTEVLKEVDTTSRVYLTRNGHGELIDIYNEREDFLWRMFRVDLRTQDSIDFWGE